MGEAVQASVLHGAKDLRLEAIELPPLESDELQIRVTRTGLCGSDLHYYSYYANGDIKVKEPLILGHESAGVVMATGDAISSNDFKVGDRVALEVGVPCEKCKLCKDGRYNLCGQLRFRSSAKSFPHFQGTLQEQLNHPARWCHKLPEALADEQGALLEPLAVALHAIKRVKLESGPRAALVTGAGAVGLLVARCLRTLGHVVIIADISEKRVAFAEKNGFADRGVALPHKKGLEIEEKLAIAIDHKQLVCKALGEECRASQDTFELFDVTFECTGAETCVQTGIYATKAGGKVALVGMGQPIQTLPLSAAALREVDLVGVFRYAGMYREGIEMFQTGQLDGLQDLITHRFHGLDKVNQACQMALKATDDQGRLVLKVMIEQ